MSLTVGQLREALRDIPPDRLVVMSQDGEGNGFSPLEAVETESRYESSSPWSGYVFSGGDVDGERIVMCVCLWPTR